MVSVRNFVFLFGFILKIGVGHLATSDYPTMWALFKKNFGKEYNLVEENFRYENFKLSVDRIQTTNSKNLSYVAGINEYSDLSISEFRVNSANPPSNFETLGDLRNESTNEIEAMGELPCRYDNRNYARVSPVWNRGMCNSAWAIVAAETVESAGAKFGTFTQVAPQQPLNCATGSSNGCFGGNPSDAITEFLLNPVCSEANMHYTAKKDTCVRCANPTYPRRNFGIQVISNNVEDMKRAVLKGVFGVGATLDMSKMKEYQGGIATGFCSVEAEPGISYLSVVGYDKTYDQTDSLSHWILKNSLGVTWGEEGYMNLDMKDDCIGPGVQARNLKSVASIV